MTDLVGVSCVMRHDTPSSDMTHLQRLDVRDLVAQSCFIFVLHIKYYPILNVYVYVYVNIHKLLTHTHAHIHIYISVYIYAHM